MKVLIGTTNPSKADWLGGLIGAGTELLTLGDVNISAEPSETGATPAENAAIKAEFYGKTFSTRCVPRFGALFCGACI